MSEQDLKRDDSLEWAKPTVNNVARGKGSKKKKHGKAVLAGAGGNGAYSGSAAQSGYGTAKSGKPSEGIGAKIKARVRKGIRDKAEKRVERLRRDEAEAAAALKDEDLLPPKEEELKGSGSSFLGISILAPGFEDDEFDECAAFDDGEAVSEERVYMPAAAPLAPPSAPGRADVPAAAPLAPPSAPGRADVAAVLSLPRNSQAPLPPSSRTASPSQVIPAPKAAAPKAKTAAAAAAPPADKEDRPEQAGVLSPEADDSLSDSRDWKIDTQEVSVVHNTMQGSRISYAELKKNGARGRENSAEVMSRLEKVSNSAVGAPSAHSSKVTKMENGSASAFKGDETTPSLLSELLDTLPRSKRKERPRRYKNNQKNAPEKPSDKAASQKEREISAPKHAEDAEVRMEPPAAGPAVPLPGRSGEEVADFGSGFDEDFEYTEEMTGGFSGMPLPPPGPEYCSPDGMPCPPQGPVYDLRSGPYPPSGPGAYGPRGGAYPPSGPGAYGPRGCVYPPSGPGAYGPQGGAYPPSVPGAYDPRGGAYPPSVPGAYGPRGGAYPPSGPGAYGPQGGAYPPSVPGAYGPRGCAYPPSVPGVYGPQQGPCPPPGPGVYGPQRGPCPPPGPGAYGSQQGPCPPQGPAYGHQHVSYPPQSQGAYAPRGACPPEAGAVQSSGSSEQMVHKSGNEAGSLSQSGMGTAKNGKKSQKRSKTGFVGRIIGFFASWLKAEGKNGGIPVEAEKKSRETELPSAGGGASVLPVNSAGQPPASAGSPESETAPGQQAKRPGSPE